MSDVRGLQRPAEVGEGDSQHLSIHVARPAGEVYAFAVEPTNLSAWASGLGSPVELVDGRWTAESPMGRVTVSFVARNDLGVLDHDVTLPSGQVVTNPMRVLAAGDGSEVVFTLRRAAGTSDNDLAGDAASVAADLATLKHTLEEGR